MTSPMESVGHRALELVTQASNIQAARRMAVPGRVPSTLLFAPQETCDAAHFASEHTRTRSAARLRPGAGGAAKSNAPPPHLNIAKSLAKPVSSAWGSSPSMTFPALRHICANSLKLILPSQFRSTRPTIARTSSSE